MFCAGKQLRVGAVTMFPPGRHSVDARPLVSQWRTFGTFIRVIKRWEDEREAAQSESESESEEELMECAVMWPTAAALLSPPLTAVINDGGRRRGRRLSESWESREETWRKEGWKDGGRKDGKMEEGRMESWKKAGRMEEGWEPGRVKNAS